MATYWWGVVFAFALTFAGAQALDLWGGWPWLVIALGAATGQAISLYRRQREKLRRGRWQVRDGQRKHEAVLGQHKITQDRLDSLGKRIAPGDPTPLCVSCKTEMLRDPVRVVLEVTNEGEGDEFSAQVKEWGQGDKLGRMVVAPLKWVRSQDEKITIAPGMTEQLVIATLEAGPAPSAAPSRGTEPAKGVVSVLVDWEPRGSLADLTFWKAEDFETRTWSLHVVISSSRCGVPHHQGVRLHLFGKAADAPPPAHLFTAGGTLDRPTLRGSPFPLPKSGATQSAESQMAEACITLISLRIDGARLLAASPTPETYAAWKEELGAWNRVVVLTGKQFLSPLQQNRLAVVTYPRLPFAPIVNDEHRDLKNALLARLNVLDQMLAELDCK